MPNLTDKTIEEQVQLLIESNVTATGEHELEIETHLFTAISDLIKSLITADRQRILEAIEKEKLPVIGFGNLDGKNEPDSYYEAKGFNDGLRKAQEIVKGKE